MVHLKVDPGPNHGIVLTTESDYRSHPLATTEAVTIDMEHDEETNSFVTYVREFDNISTFGDSEYQALEMTAEMMGGWIESMEENGMKVPLSKSKLAEVKRIVGV